MNYRQQAALDFAERITALGFIVYLATGSGYAKNEYGFITDKTKSRVLSFSFSGFDSKLSGNYGPPSQTSGTGWGHDVAPGDLITKQDVTKALYANPPGFCGNGWKYMTTVEQHLKTYGASSVYEIFKPADQA